MTYQPDWDIDKARGEEAEGLYRELRSAVLAGTAEVKRDDRARQTGKFYVEYECHRRDGWHPSGIAATKAETWVIVAEPTVVAIPVETVLRLSRDAWRAGQRAECVVGSHPTRGVLLSLDRLLLDAVHTTAEGMPTDEPPPPAPHDTDPDAARCVPSGAVVDTLDWMGESLGPITRCPACGVKSSENYGDRGYCWPCWQKQPAASGWTWPGHGDC